MRPPPTSTLFPYTTLFRSAGRKRDVRRERDAKHLRGVNTCAADERDRATAASDARNHDVGWNCRSEEHTSELQSRRDLVCRLLLEKKKETTTPASCHSATY